MDKHQILSQYFGYSQFRPGQEKLIDGVLSGRDVFGIMPTGGGKSICYQVPAMLLPGITVVISPLISLMQDQVTTLQAMGIPAAYINGTLSSQQLNTVYRNLLTGQYKLIYVAPERLDHSGFIDAASRLNISFLAVDEAHCISQWGQDFRPSYLRIVQFIANLPRRPVVGAFTATATKRVREDVERILMLQQPERVVTGFDRTNLFFEVMRPDYKDTALLRLLAARREKSGIIYCMTRKKVESICQLLQSKGYAATRYHAGLEEAERKRNQDNFIHDRKTVMVATNAFGMGIDKSNVSYVIHYNMPQSIEAYYQEAGRAGRDGAEAECILLYSPSDEETARYLINTRTDNEELTQQQQDEVRHQDLQRLEDMSAYCTTKACLRGFILSYFGQSHPAVCGNCGSCRGDFDTVDVTREAQMLLSCVKRIHTKLGKWVGLDVISRVLRGIIEPQIQQLGLEQLSTFGLMKGKTYTQIRNIAAQLEADGYLKTDGEWQQVQLTAEASSVLYHSKQVQMLVRKEHKTSKTGVSVQKLNEQEIDLFDALCALRANLAEKAKVPAYTIFSNATLQEMARKKPENMTQLRRISGVGEIKASWYGTVFLAEIKKFLEI